MAKKEKEQEMEYPKGAEVEKIDLMIGEVVPNKNNPRIIKDANFMRLKKSIQEFPEMMKIRPIVVDENNVILGGNMRFKACTELGFTTISAMRVKGLTEEQKKEFLVKDNKSLGDWDWEVLSEGWNADDLADWGFGDWEKKKKTVDTKEAFDAEFDATKDGDASMPIIPKFDEKYEMIIIVSESEVDSNWLRERLGLQKMRSYKTGKVIKGSVINVKDLYDVL